MSYVLKEIWLKGSPVSSGIAIGRLFLMTSTEEEELPDFTIAADEVEEEINRYRKAISSSREDLKELHSFLKEEGSEDAVTIIDSHIQMLEDPWITTLVEEKIRDMRRNTEAVFKSVMTDYEDRFSKVDDSFFRQRLLDVKDLSSRVLKHLYPSIQSSFAEIPLNAVICAKEFVPSDTAEAPTSKVSGFISQIGGITSHAALIARAKGVPYVASIDIKTMEDAINSIIIIDGETGDVIINPSEATTTKYYERKRELTRQHRELSSSSRQLAITKDGVEITLLANIESLHDLNLLHHYGAKGIGLFRSEFLFLQRELLTTTEQEQFLLYAQVVEKANGLPITFRVFDIGGDKAFMKDYWFHEPNPALGCRGIRFLLAHEDIFKAQIRALLRAGVYGNIKILLPMISDVYELKEARRFIELQHAELIREGVPVASKIEIGSMVEVPSAVMMGDVIAEESDFLSIGTNDLIQYTLAIDRANPVLQTLFSPAHPSIIRMITMVVDHAKKAGKQVSVCGEMASDPLFVPLLLGLGITQFSSAPRHIPHVRKAVCAYSMKEAEELVKNIKTMQSAIQIEEYLRPKIPD